MSGLNQWRGIVNVGADAELRFTQGGQPVLNFRGACNEKYQSNGQEKEITTWLGFVVWGKRAEALSKHVGKGDRLLIEGPLRLSEYEAREGGKRLKVEVVVERLEFMGGRERGASGDHDNTAPRGNGGGRSSGGSARGGGGYRGYGHPDRGSPAPASPADAADAFAGGHPADGFSNDDEIPF